MRIPFAEVNDVTTTASAGKIPKADANGFISSAWLNLNSQAGSTNLYGFIAYVLPNLSASVKALGYEQSTDQVKFWDGTVWRTIA
jgi:hypothetical protein